MLGRSADNQDFLSLPGLRRRGESVRRRRSDGSELFRRSRYRLTLRLRRGTHSPAGLEVLSQLPDLTNHVPAFVMCHSTCIEVLIQATQPRGPVKKPTDTAVQVHQVKQTPSPGN